MKRTSLIECVFLLLILCACTKQSTMQPAMEKPIADVLEQVENKSAALDTGVQESKTRAEAQTAQSEDSEPSVFTGGITLYADSQTALVNSEPVQMPAAPFVENGIFYIPLQFVSKTMGWTYQEQDGVVVLRSGSSSTTLTVGERTISIDGTQTAVSRYDWQLPDDGSGCDAYVPLIRSEYVFIPLSFLSDQTDSNILSNLNFRTQWFPEENYAILSGNGQENGLCGFYVWDVYDDLPEKQRAPMVELGVVGFSREAYDVVEYGANGLFVHVLRLRAGCEDSDQLDGVISAAYTTNPDIPTPRGLRVGEDVSRIYATYDSDFYMQLLCITEADTITKIRFSSYYDDDETIRTQPTCLHMDAAEAEGRSGLPSFE